MTAVNKERKGDFMKNTVNYGLNMPDLDDFYNINDFNENAETIDNVMHENELAINALSENTQAALDGVSEKIGETTDTGATENTGTVMGKLNKNIENSDSIKNFLINSMKAEYPDVEFSTNGSYTTTIPPIATGVKITACGAGGSGGGSYNSGYTVVGGGGGGGGAAISQKLYNIPENLLGKVIDITVGKGGTSVKNSTQNGVNGGNTVIQNFVTLTGGKGGKSSNNGGTGGAAGGTGGGAGGKGAVYGNTASNGSNGVVGSGGDGGKGNMNSEGTKYNAGGGGGGSIGAGGHGGYCGSNSNLYIEGGVGVKGGGGGGGFNNYSGESGAGGDGYVKLEWVWE